MRNGRFITFEGGEGAGKSTQIRRLATRLRTHAREVVATREPGGTPLAERLRSIILAGGARDFGDFGEALLFSAARIDHIDRIIRPALARGAFVLCDRFADSTRAYQGARGGAEENMLAILEAVTLGGVRPDLTFILDLAPEIGLERARARRGQGGADRFEGEDLAFHALLRDKFLGIARAEPERCRVVDAAKPEDEVAEAIWSACLEQWPLLATEGRQWA
ncbi:dTMP kinase [Rhodoblastus acidophilus]|uniref:Thymidylate kinase n=1 Tax=Candidatus Rhodoblastus alkanivorans TaxID=2954117 RepID=A0ABS9Z9Z8_9HYPH|nr:dTMP kinase [Candidatus Rhodoblastus alkanivorans]MCI4678752.1 dTMP kinase [Candidatus Rhodoblastus alkanivorans]MCI4683452.1 dTMP kinase [Candidatus Rhodoblastus alkanivorans]MDI4640766.1 dTMP kinase [Rhodoblastus acidophilus]